MPPPNANQLAVNRAGEDDVLGQVARTGIELQSLLGSVLASIAPEQVRPLWLVNTLGLNKDLASRLVNALACSDPVAVVHSLPGPVPLRQFVDAAGRSGASPERVTLARAAVDRFDALMREHFDERGELDALLGASLREARRKAESTAKQAMYRGSVGLKGVSCETSFVAFLIAPSKEAPGWCDTAMVGGMLGLRRHRPDSIVEYTSVLAEQDHRRVPLFEGNESGLIPEFCHPTDPPIETTGDGERVRYLLGGKGVGRQAAVNIVLGEFYPKNHPQQPVPDRPSERWVYATIEQPSRRLVLDVLLHESVWPSVLPQLRIYDTCIHGTCDPASPRAERQQLMLAESIDMLGTGVQRARHTHIPRHTDLLRKVADSRGWSPEAFRVHRCEIMYPVYGSQVCVVYRT